MPRRYRRGKRTYRKRPFKKFKKIYKTKKNGTKVYYFKRTRFDDYSITMPASIGTFLQAIPSDGTAYNNFTLDSLPSYSEYANLFDSYKINGIRQKFILDVNSSDIGTSTAQPNGLPTLLTVNDYNDRSAIASEDEVMQYKSYRNKRMVKAISRYFKPTETDNMTGGLGNIIKRRWNPTYEPDIPHLGLKAAIVGYNFTGNTTILGRLRVYTTFYVSFMTPK